MVLPSPELGKAAAEAGLGGWVGGSVSVILKLRYLLAFMWGC